MTFDEGKWAALCKSGDGAGREDVLEAYYGLRVVARPGAANLEQGRALLAAVEAGDAAAARAILAGDPPPDLAFAAPDAGTTALHAAAARGSPLVLDLLNAGAPLDARAAAGRTPLHAAAAASAGGVDCARAVELLLAAGADVRSLDDDMVSPVDAAGEGPVGREGHAARHLDVVCRLQMADQYWEEYYDDGRARYAMATADPPDPAEAHLSEYDKKSGYHDEAPSDYGLG